MRIFYQLANQKTILPDNGDTTNEINFMKALSTFAEVYYSGNLFQPNLPDYGLSEYNEPILSRLNDSYDVYYIRANRDVLLNCPKNKPKIWVGSPFDKDCYEQADMIATYSERWAEILRKGIPIGYIPSHLARRWKTALNVNQVVGESFKPLKKHERSKEIYNQIGASFLVGYFGRLVESTYPFAFLSEFKKFSSRFPGFRFLIGTRQGKLQRSHNNSKIIMKHFSYEDVPYAISACDVILLSNWGYEWDLCGCTKLLEACACGIPVVLPYSSARAEVLGKDYPFFIPPLQGLHKRHLHANIIYKTLQKLMKMKKKKRLRSIGKTLEKKVKPYTIKFAGERLKRIFVDIVNRKNNG